MGPHPPVGRGTGATGPQSSCVREEGLTQLGEGARDMASPKSAVQVKEVWPGLDRRVWWRGGRSVTWPQSGHAGGGGVTVFEG